MPSTLDTAQAFQSAPSATGTTNAPASDSGSGESLDALTKDYSKLLKTQTDAEGKALLKLMGMPFRN